MANPRIIFVLGGPGCGKGTQCQKICETFSEFVHLSAGELLREARTSRSALGEMIEKCMMEGTIVPAEVTVNLLREAMEKNGWTAKRYLIDGFPRNDDNYSTWFRLMPNVQVDYCLYLNCNDEVMIQRIMGRGEGRSDDNLETVSKRLRTYKESTQPVIKRFEDDGRLAEINAEGAVDDIFERVKQGLRLI